MMVYGCSCKMFSPQTEMVTDRMTAKADGWFPFIKGRIRF